MEKHKEGGTEKRWWDTERERNERTMNMKLKKQESGMEMRSMSLTRTMRGKTKHLKTAGDAAREIC